MSATQVQQIPLKVLIVEDSEHDMLLLLKSLRNGGFQVTSKQVENAEELRQAITNESWQIIICDYNLPIFNARKALEMVKPLQIPFFVVSGTIGEDIAAELMRSGAQDYVMKDNLTRLIPAIYRELDEAERRHEIQLKLQQKEEQLRQSQKMEAIGRLAGGIAHDFNNFLGAMMMTGENIMTKLEKNSAVHNQMLETQDMIQRAAALTKQLLMFSKRQPLTVAVLDLNTTVERMHTMWQRILDDNIKCELDLEKELGKIRLDQSQLEQVLMNLIVNARDAMGSGGLLKVKTSTVSTTGNLTSAHANIPAGKYCVLSVQDTGSGMDKKTLECIFEPFFTTKGDKGTGLGLATVFGIVQSSGGYINVTSEVNKGTEFQIYFPYVDAAVTTEQPAENIQLTPTAKTILLVEDQKDLRNALADCLKDKGYEVIAAESPAQAVEMCNAYKNNIDLLITDLMMPGMNGLELRKKIQAVRPQIKAILISGYFNHDLLDQEPPSDENTILQKPFSFMQLLQKIETTFSNGKKQ